MNAIILILILLLNINCEDWYDEVDLYDLNSNNGYAGTTYYNITDFYLCGERKYRVHYLGDDEDNWSREFQYCEPIGIDKYIDGIAISGGKPYNVRAGSSFLGEVKGYNISDYYYGLAGNLKNAINSIGIGGRDFYRSGYGNNSSNEVRVAERLIPKLFLTDIKSFPDEYNKENPIIDRIEPKITIEFLHMEDFNYKGKVNLKIEENKISYSDWGGVIGNNLNRRLKEVIEYDINEVKKWFEDVYQEKLKNGNIVFNFKWEENITEIDTFSKILYEYPSYRGGFKIRIYLSNVSNDSKLLNKIKNICKVFLQYSGKFDRNTIKDLLSDFDSLEKINKIINELDIYSTMAEYVIFFTILLPTLNK